MASQTFLLQRCMLNIRLPQFVPIVEMSTKSRDLFDVFPAKPKRPLSPFFRFAQTHRPQLVKQYPQLKITEVMKKVAEDWQRAHRDVKSKLEEEYKAEMVKFSLEYKEYKNNLTSDQTELLKLVKSDAKKAKVKRELKKKITSLNKPKKPSSGYGLFLQQEAGTGNKTFGQLMIESKEKWIQLSPKEKEEFLKKAAELKLEYDVDLKAWENKMIQEEKFDVVRKKTLEEIGVINKVELKKSVSKMKTQKDNFEE